MEYELKANRHIHGCGLGFVPDYYPEEGRWLEPYAFNEGDKITMKVIGSEDHDYFDDELYTKGLASPEGAWSTPYLDQEGGGTVLCTFSRPVVMEPDKEIAGVFGADLSLEGISSLIVESLLKENEESPFLQTVSDDPELLIYGFIIEPKGDYIVHLLQYTNAGHNAPFVITDGKPRMMPVDANIPVGIMADWSYSLQETTLSPGTILFLYTDGLTEATRSDGELFQEERVQAQLSGHDGNTSAERLVADMTAAVNRFIGDAEQSDDLTMLVLKMLKGRD